MLFSTLDDSGAPESLLLPMLFFDNCRATRMIPLPPRGSSIGEPYGPTILWNACRDSAPQIIASPSDPSINLCPPAPPPQSAFPACKTALSPSTPSRQFSRRGCAKQRRLLSH